MEQDEKKSVVTFELTPDLKKWLELKAAERIIGGYAHGERSVGAVIRDLIVMAIEQETVAA